MSIAEQEKSPTIKELKSKKEVLASKLRYQRDKDREIVKGIFRFYEVPGGSMGFSFKMYKEDAVEKHTLKDGEVYPLPLGVAKHLNKSGWYPVHEFALDDNGRPLMKIGKKVRRYGFQSLEFVDIDDLTPVGGPLITVENI